MDPWIWDKVRLELVQINVERAIKTQTRGDRADDLGDETIQVLVVWPRDVEVPPTDVVHGFIVDQKGTIRALNGTVGGQDGIVRLHHRSRHAWCGVHGEFQLRLLAVVGSEPFEEKSAEPRTSAAAERVEDQEALQGRALVWRLSALRVVGLDSVPPPATRLTRSMTLSTSSLPTV